jgi:predicted oxidoreductase
MKTYKIPKTDLIVSCVAAGCMSLAGSWDIKVPVDSATTAKARAFIETVLSNGINFFDHADIYCATRSETAFGNVLRETPGLREKMVLQTKCGIIFRGRPNPDSPPRYDFSYEHIVTTTEASLKRLGTDHLDIQLLHRPDLLCEPEEVARAFDHLHGSGKVRYFGVSNHSASQIELLKRSVRQPLVVNQLQLSLSHAWLIEEGIYVNQLDAKFAAASGLLDYCRLNDILVQAWSPADHGRLAEPRPDIGDRETRIAAEVARVAAEVKATPGSVVLAWLLRHPAGIQPVIGTTNAQRIAESAAAADVQLSREQWWRLLIAGRGGRVP